MSEKIKQTKGKPRFWGRVDIPAMTEPVAELRRVIIEDIKKYPETMEWPNIHISVWVDAIQRHLDDIREENNVFAVDPETGLPHFFAIGFSYMVISREYRKKNSTEKDKKDGNLFILSLPSGGRKMVFKTFEEGERYVRERIGDRVSHTHTDFSSYSVWEIFEEGKESERFCLQQVLVC